MGLAAFARSERRVEDRGLPDFDAGLAKCTEGRMTGRAGVDYDRPSCLIWGPEGWLTSLFFCGLINTEGLYVGDFLMGFLSP